MKTFFAKSFSVLIMLSIFLSVISVHLALAASGDLDPTFNPGGAGANGTVNALVRQSDGKILIGGNFTEYNGDANAPDYILRLNADGTLDTDFNYDADTRGTDGEVWSIALQPDGKILVGGAFSTYNGEADANVPDNILRLNSDGSRDTSFSGAVQGANNDVVAIAVQSDGKILLGGFFTAYNTNSEAPDRILRLNANGSLDSAFNVGAGTRGANLTVEAIVIQPDGKIVIGGGFNSYNGNATGTARKLVRLNASDGSRDPTFKSDGFFSSASIRALALQPNDKILVGGYFTSYGVGNVPDVNTPDYLMRVNTDGSLDTTFNYGGNGAYGALFGAVKSVVIQPDGKILVGGSFTSYNGDSDAPDHLLRVNNNGTLDTSFNHGAGQGANDEVNCLAIQPDLKVLAGGWFTSYDGNGSVPDYVLRLTNVLAVTINQAATQTDPTSNSPINFTVVFSSPVTGFGDAAGDVSLSGTAGGTLTATVSESGPMNGTTYTVAVSGMTSSGTVIASIPANAAQDADSNGNMASTSVDNIVTYSVAVVPSPTPTLVPTATPSGGGTDSGADGGGYRAGLPATGFRPGLTTLLPAQPAEKAYTNYNDLILEIPSLQVSMPIVGVPLSADGWDVTWLGNNAGWLNGTAFPTWAGNTVITAHVWDAYNRPGPFAQLKTLRYGDVIKIQAWGQTYQYEVRESRLVSPRNTTTVTKHEELDWVTLITCEDYNFLFAKYSYRRVVRAVLTEVSGQ